MLVTLAFANTLILKLIIIMLLNCVKEVILFVAFFFPPFKLCKF